jgi:hypothetical protein
MATSKFIKEFETTAGAKLQSALVYIVPSGAAFNTDMPLTAHITRKGIYSRDAVPDGEYDIYINYGSGAVLYEEHIYHSDEKLSKVAANFNADGTFKTKASTEADGAQSKEDKSLFDKMADLHNTDGTSKEVENLKTGIKSYPKYFKDYIPLPELSNFLLTGYPDVDKISGTDKVGLHSCLKLYNIKANTIIKIKGMPFNDPAGYGQAMSCIAGVLSYSNIFRFQNGYKVTADCEYIVINTELSPGNLIANKIGNNAEISVWVISEEYSNYGIRKGVLDLVDTSAIFANSFLNEAGGVSSTAAEIATSYFVPVKANKKVYCSKIQALAEYDESGNYIADTYQGSFYTANKSVCFTTNASTRYLRVASDGTPGTWNCRVYYGTQRGSADNLKETIVNESGHEILPSDLSNGQNSLFDKTLCTENSFINSGGSISSTILEIIVSPKIEVEPNRDITASKITALAEYDASDVFIPGSYKGIYYAHNKEITIRTKPTTKYIRVASDGTKESNSCIVYYGAGKTADEISQTTLLHNGAELNALSTISLNLNINKNSINNLDIRQRDLLNKSRLKKNIDFCRHSRRTYGAKDAVIANSYSVAVIPADYSKIIDFFLNKGLANAVNPIDGRFITLKDVYEDFSNINVEDQNGNPLEHFIWSKGNYKLVPTNDYGGEILITTGGVNLITSTGKVVYAKDGKINITTPGGATEVLSGHGTVEELKVIANNDRLFYQTSGTSGVTLRYTDLAGDKVSHIISGFENVDSVAIPSGFAWNDTTLIMGRYQVEMDLAIYRSLNNGVTWTRVVNRTDFKHVHGLHYDKYQDVFYAGLDSESNGILKSVDDGLTWSVMDIPTRNQCFVEMFSGPGFRLFAAEGDIRGSWTIYKTYDDINFFEVLYAHQDVFAIRELNGVIIATGLGGKVANRTACIYISYDNGDTWEEILKEKTLYDYGVGVGNKFISTPVTINGEKCLILGTLDSEGGDYTNKLFYCGKSNYQAWMQIKINPDTTNVVFRNGSLSMSNLNKLYALYGKGGQEIPLKGVLPGTIGELNRLGWMIPETYMAVDAFILNETEVKTGVIPTGNFSVIFDFKENYEDGNTRNLVKCGNLALGRSDDSTVLRTMLNGNSTDSLGINCSSEHFEKHLFSVDVVNKKLVHGHGNLYNCDTVAEAFILDEIVFGAVLNSVNGEIGNVRYYGKFITEQEWYDYFNGATI